jgi:hypothetical protein
LITSGHDVRWPAAAGLPASSSPPASRWGAAARPEARQPQVAGRSLHCCMPAGRQGPLQLLSTLLQAQAHSAQLRPPRDLPESRSGHEQKHSDKCGRALPSLPRNGAPIVSSSRPAASSAVDRMDSRGSAASRSPRLP